MSRRKSTKKSKNPRKADILYLSDQPEVYIKKLDEKLFGIFLEDGTLIGMSTDYYAAQIRIKEENMKLVTLQ